jgi:hypothetical protein
MLSLIGRYPETQVCELLGGISRHTLGRLIGCLPVMRGTVAIVNQALEGLGLDTPAGEAAATGASR